MRSCAFTMFALVSVKNCALSKLITVRLHYIVLYTDCYIIGHSNFVCVAYFFVFQEVGSPFFVKFFLGSRDAEGWESLFYDIAIALNTIKK